MATPDSNESELDRLEREAKARRLKKEILELTAATTETLEARQLDMQLKSAQLRKAEAEAKIAQKVTPTLETIKLVSSLIIGIGGAIAGFAGVQFAKVEKQEAEIAKAKALQETEALSKSQASLKKKIERIGGVLDESQKVAQHLHKDTAELLLAVSALQVEIDRNPNLAAMVTTARQKQENLADGLRVAHRLQVEQMLGKPIPPASELVEDIFGETAEQRLSAFEEFSLFYRTDDKIIPLITKKATVDHKNSNGIYNALVAFSVMPPEALKKHETSILALVQVADAIGPRTARKIEEIKGIINGSQPPK